MGERTFGNSTHIFTGAKGIAFFYGGSKFPSFLAVQAVGINAALQEPAGLLCQNGQGILQTVINLTQQTGAQVGRQHITGKFHGVTALDTVGHFIDLDLCHIATDTDDLTFQCGLADFHVANFVHRNVALEFHGQQVAVHTCNLTNIFGHCVTSCVFPPTMES